MNFDWINHISNVCLSDDIIGNSVIGSDTLSNARLDISVGICFREIVNRCIVEIRLNCITFHTASILFLKRFHLRLALTIYHYFFPHKSLRTIWFQVMILSCLGRRHIKSDV